MISICPHDSLTPTFQDYQAAIARLDKIDADSTQAEMDFAYTAVENAYRLVVISFCACRQQGQPSECRLPSE
jgi:hypothetical protein